MAAPPGPTFVYVGGLAAGGAAPPERGGAVAGDEATAVEVGDGADEVERGQIVDTLRVGMVARLRWVAPHADDAGSADGGRAEDVTLKRDPVAVLAGHLHDRLDAHLAQNDARAKRRHAPDATLVVGKVDRVDVAAHRAGELFQGTARRAFWRRDLAGDGDLPGLEPALKGAVCCHRS